MFDKLKNIKFSFKKKSKGEDDTQSSLDDDIFSASDGGGDEDFFSEPSFGAEGIDGGEGPSGGDISLTDSDEDEISTPDRFGESSTVFSQDDLLKSSKVVKGGSTRRTLLLFVLFLAFSGYAAYAYILPQYYPDLLAELMAKITGEEVAVKKEAPQKVAVKKTVPPKPAPAKPAPPKPAVETPKTEAPAKPTETKPVEKAAVPAPPPPVPVKAEVARKEVVKVTPPPAAPAADTGKKEVAPKPEEPVKTEPVKAQATAPAPPAAKPAEPPLKKAEPVIETPAIPEQKVAAPVQPVVVPSQKERKDIIISPGSIPVADKGYYLQEGVYIFKGNLKEPRKKIESLGYTALVKQGRKVIKMNRLLVGEWGDFLIAEDLVKRLRQNGFSAELISKNERFSALIGSFYYKHMADKKKASLKKKGFDARIEKTPINMKVHHLLVGPYNTPEEADAVLDSLKRKGLKAVIMQKR